MKTRRIIAIAMALVMMLVLTACGGGVDITGKYSCKAMETGGMVLDPTTFGEEINFEIKKDGTFTMNMAEEENGGTWEYKDGKVSLTAEGETIECDYADGVITMEEDENIIYFVIEGGKLPEDIQKAVDEFDLEGLLGEYAG